MLAAVVGGVWVAVGAGGVLVGSVRVGVTGELLLVGSAGVASEERVAVGARAVVGEGGAGGALPPDRLQETSRKAQQTIAEQLGRRSMAASLSDHYFIRP